MVKIQDNNETMLLSERKKKFTEFLKSKDKPMQMYFMPETFGNAFIKKRSSDIPEPPHKKFNLIRWILSKL